MTTALKTHPAVARLQALEADLNSRFAERRAEVRSLLTALVAGEHVLLLGPPGTAKSALVNALAAALGAPRTFTVLMTRFTVPEEVFGPISLAGLEQDQYRRVTAGYLPEAQFAFLDECFKANSAILNALLTALNERAFDDGGQRRAIPLELAVGASNELPTDTALEALMDRFMLRHWVAPVQDRSALRRILAGGGAGPARASLQAGDLAALRALAQQVVLTDDVLDAMLDLRESLAREASVEVSDRRWVKAAWLVRAHAAVEGRTRTAARDLGILAHALWRTPDQRAAVAAQVAGVSSPNGREALRLVDAAAELYAKAKDAPAGAAGTTLLATANQELGKVLREVRALSAQGTDPEVDEAAEKVATMKVEVARRAAAALGL